MLKIRPAPDLLPDGVEWKWTRVTHAGGIILVVAGLIARAVGHIQGAQLAYSVAAIVVFALGAWRRSVHLEAYIRKTRQELNAGDRMSAVGLSTASFAHDMKNSTMVTSGFAQLARRTAESKNVSPELLTQLKALEEQSFRTVSDLRAYLALAHGETPITLPPIPLRDALEQTARLLGPMTRLKELQLENSLDGQLDRPVAEPSFRQALLNLGLNAVEHAKSKVRFVTAQHDDHIAVMIEDDGPGVPADERKLLFTPFSSTRSNGTGLGLANVKAGVEREGGQITYEEAPGGGARFNVRLPVISAQSPTVSVSVA